MTKPYVNLEQQGGIYSDPLDALLFNSDFVGENYHGAIIDNYGNEEPINEAMILEACASLEKELESIYGSEFSGK
jgi:hypothetical protein